MGDKRHDRRRGATDQGRWASWLAVVGVAELGPLVQIRGQRFVAWVEMTAMAASDRGQQ